MPVPPFPKMPASRYKPNAPLQQAPAIPFQSSQATDMATTNMMLQKKKKRGAAVMAALLNQGKF